MKAIEIMRHFQKIGTWVDWDNTSDQFLHGDPEIKVTGIAVSWIATNDAIRKAGKAKLNLFITHEPSLYDFDYYTTGLFQKSLEGKKLIDKKKEVLDKFGITLMRCHDTWDLMPNSGICDEWGNFLGFKTEERPIKSYYKICLVNNLSIKELSKLILKKVKLLGQDSVKVIGDMGKKVKRMVIGTGAVTVFPEMNKLNPDVILATEDGMRHWDAGLWALDLQIPFIVVNHAISEIPGMKSLSKYLQSNFNNVPVEYINTIFPYITLY